MSVTAVPILPVKRSYIAWIWIGIALAVVAAFLLAMQGDNLWAKSTRGWDVKATGSGLKYRILAPGSGPKLTDNDVALVNYEVRLPSGQVLGKSQQPTPMPVAGGRLAGLTEGLKLMSKGSKYTLFIPPSLSSTEAQRDQDGKELVPAKSPLIFEVEVIETMPLAEFEQMMRQQQMMGGGGGPGGPGGMPGGPGGGAGAPPGEDLVPPTGK